MKILVSCILLLAATIAALSLDRGRSAVTVPDAYLHARQKIFAEVSVTLSDNIEDNDLIHVLMETWRDDVLVLLVVRKDGSVRLIDSSGRDVAPPARNVKQRELCSAYFRNAEKDPGFTIKTLLTPVPEKGSAFFYFFTVNRQYRSGGNVEDLAKTDSGFSRLYRSFRLCLAEVEKTEQ